MNGRRKSFRNVFKSKSYRRSMDAVDDAFYAEQAKKRAEGEADEALATPQEPNKNNGDKKNG